MTTPPLVEDLLQLVQAARAVLPREPVPAFAHMRLLRDGRSRDVLLGFRTHAAANLTILDWQRSPLAAVFFECGPGEEYEVEVDGRVLGGRLLEKSLLGFERGELVTVLATTARFRRNEAGGWREEAGGALVSLLGREPEAKARSGSPVEVPLDEAQRRVVQLPPGRDVLVLGEAGSGKTTVALHRLALLLRGRPGVAPLRRAAVVVPTEGLRRFEEALLDRLGATGVEVWLYDRFAAMQARRAFPDLPRKESQGTRPGVLRIKRHPALRRALDELCDRPAREAAHRGRARHSDLLHLFGDRRYLEQVVADAGGALRAGDVEETLMHTRVQFGATTEEAFAHVDAERLQAVDARALDEGTPTEDAGTVDVEDYAVLLELDRLRAARRGDKPPRLRGYECLFVDEAQELAPLELALLGRSLVPGGTLVVAGDAGQQVDPTSFFVDFRHTMADLGAGSHQVTALEVTYRSPPAVTELARGLLALPAPVGERHVEDPDAEARVACLRFDNECHLVATLSDVLRQLRGDDPTATVAVICRTREGARRLAGLLERAVHVQLALDGEFVFGPGINVTCVDEVKGLEFDYVVVPDAAAAVWPDTPASRRALYVAVTRTVHQLVFAAVGAFTALLGDARARVQRPAG